MRRWLAALMLALAVVAVALQVEKSATAFVGSGHIVADGVLPPHDPPIGGTVSGGV